MSLDIKILSEKVGANVLCVGIVCLTILEIIALAMGFNGTLFKIVIVLIALAIGVTIPMPDIFKKK